jgi:DNA polymerase (family 10)
MEKDVNKIAEEVVSKIRHVCSRVKIAGSIRRGNQNPKDIDIVCIPKDKEKLKVVMEKIGKYEQGGEHESTWNVKGVNVELYYTNEKEWGAELMAYSSKKGAGIGLRMIAKRKGLKLNQHGLFNRKTGKRIAGKTEEEIYKALGRKYKTARER